MCLLGGGREGRDREFRTITFLTFSKVMRVKGSERERESIEKSLLRRQIRARRARALATIARVDDPLSERAHIYVYVL